MHKTNLIYFVWLRMTSRYGHRWTSNYGDEPGGIAAAEWRDALSGCGQAEVDSGFAADLRRGDGWPPSSSEFRAMCFSIPSFATIKPRASRTTEPTRFEVLVWQNVDSYRYRQADADKAERMLRDGYEIAREHVMAGGDLPELPEAMIEHKEPDANPMPADALQKKMRELADEIGMELEP